MTPYSVLLLTGLVVAGCCTNVTTDPRKGGLAGGVCGSATGAYRNAIVERQTTLAALDRSEAALSADLASSRGNEKTLEAAIVREQRRLASERQAVSSLRAEVEAMRADNEAAAARRDALLAEVASIEGEVADLIGRSSEHERVARAMREGIAVAASERQLGADVAADDGKLRDAHAKYLALRTKLSAAN